MMGEQESYLGDGVHASHDGYHIWLRVDGFGRSERIALEPQVFDALLQYRESLKQKPSKQG